ncbi:MAG: ABC transporter permease [Blautia sp.]|nr:ABC transporter permease [Blautia sp.]MDY3997911.1 ABC transporter permease [Blautia sp.]
MRKGLFVRLALTNIRKNRGTYIPYILTCICCIAMLYMMLFIQANPGMEKVPGGSDIGMIMWLGIFVVGVFSCIFLLYSNSFLMKRRQKELGLYNILGMEKGHIGKMMFLETIFTSIFSLAAGILVGILGSKLALLLLLKLIHLPAQFGFYISGTGIVICIIGFGGIFLLTLVNNLRRVHLSRPVELLCGSSAGEREPKAKWLMALIGFICLGVGYYIAVTTESPLEALYMFLIAVLLVMAGTYLVFTSGSIAVLKMLRWKKSFYYKMKNFTSVSGMIYRMKQNAVGLASICILSTGVLLMLSSTVCLNFGIEDCLNYRYPYDMNINIRYASLEETRNAVSAVLDAVEKEEISYETFYREISLNIAYIKEGTELVFRNPGSVSDVAVGSLAVIPEEEYERISGTGTELSEGQVIAYGQSSGETLRISGTDFQVKEWLKKYPLDSAPLVYGDYSAVIVTDADFEKIDELQKKAYGEYASQPSAVIGIDVADKEQISACVQKLEGTLTGIKDSGVVPENAWVTNDVRQENYDRFYLLYGGLFFLGILLGGMFLMGTAMIIYYKQMSEGYEDKQRFEIMRKVGMSSREVRSSIRRQILMVFFLPLLMAILHIIMAFPLVKRLLLMLGMANTRLFMMCTAGTILVFAAVYAVIYMITARSYYKILQKAE